MVEPDKASEFSVSAQSGLRPPREPDHQLLEGSRRNLEALLAVHEDLSGQGGGVVVLGGPRGVGKALLLAELRRELSSRGRHVLFGRAEHLATQPYATLREPAAQALSWLEARGLAEEFLDRHARALAVLLPSIATPRTGARARDKTAFFEALRAFFLDLGQIGPLSLLLADLHDADDDSKEAVRFLARHLFDPEVPAGDGERAFHGVLMAASRSDDEDGPKLTRALAGGRRGRVFEVASLTKEGLLAYLQHHPLLDRLLTASRGRLDDVDELLETLPKDTDALVLTRARALDPSSRGVLEALSVFGRPASPDLLAAILEKPVSEVAHALGGLVEQRALARRLQNGELLFAFSRPHHREVIAAHLDAAHKSAIHGAIGNALESFEKRGSDAGEQLLAFHLLRGPEPARGVRYALAACERLVLTFAYGAAVELATRALPAAQTDERFALLGHMLEAHRLRGELLLALDAVAEMRKLARPAQVPTVLRRSGELLGARGEHKAALEALTEALTLLDEQRGTAGDSDVDEAVPERALIRVAMAEVAYARGDLDGAEHHAEGALQAAPRAPVAFSLRVSNTLGKIQYSRDRYDESERRFLDNLKRADENGLDHEGVLARINTGLARHRLGRNDEAREALEKALTKARAIGDIANEAHALSNLSAIAQRTGDLAGAIRSYRAALALFSRVGNRTEVRRTTWNLANIHVTVGDTDAARSYLDQSRALAEAEDSPRGRAFVHYTEGDLAFAERQPGLALAAYDKARALFQQLGEPLRIFEASVQAAWSAVHLGDASLARVRMAELPPPSTPAQRALVEAVLGALATLSDSREWTAGAAQLSAAVDALERHHAHDDAWRALAFLADRFDEHGDKQSARGARARARAIVDGVAGKLPVELRDKMLLDPARAALREEVHERAAAPPQLSPAPPERTTLLPQRAPDVAPAFRRPEWDVRYKDVIGHAPAILRTFERLDRIAGARQATVLIRGESGTGKELVAAAVHRLSERAAGPFVRVNCAALVETLLMSELFGHEKGSFTGALARKIGRFELARGGTIFLDEIGDISAKTQVSLLRVLQERQFERVGGTQTISTDAVVICATHRDLEEMVRQGNFREDLYYRLRGVVVEVPALRERPEDIPLLCRAYLKKAKEELGRAPLEISPAAEELLQRYRWPGNIRELQNVIRSVALFCEGDVVDVEHLSEFPELFHEGGPAERRGERAGDRSFDRDRSDRSDRPRTAPPRAPDAQTPPPSAAQPSAPPTTRDVMRRVEAEAAHEGLALGDLKRRIEFEAIANAMRQTGGNITRAAAMLKMKRPRLSQIVNGNEELKAIKQASRDGEDD